MGKTKLITCKLSKVTEFSLKEISQKCCLSFIYLSFHKIMIRLDNINLMIHEKPEHHFFPCDTNFESNAVCFVQVNH